MMVRPRLLNKVFSSALPIKHVLLFSFVNLFIVFNVAVLVLRRGLTLTRRKNVLSSQKNSFQNTPVVSRIMSKTSSLNWIS